MIPQGFPLYTVSGPFVNIVIGWETYDGSCAAPWLVRCLDFSLADQRTLQPGRHITGAPFLGTTDLSYYVHSIEAERAAHANYLGEQV